MERTKCKEILSLEKTGCQARRAFRKRIQGWEGWGGGGGYIMYKRRRKEFWGAGQMYVAEIYLW